MYSTAAQVWQGLAKNATEGMATPGRLPLFLCPVGGHVLPSCLFSHTAALRHHPVVVVVAASATRTLLSAALARSPTFSAALPLVVFTSLRCFAAAHHSVVRAAVALSWLCRLMERPLLRNGGRRKLRTAAAYCNSRQKSICCALRCWKLQREMNRPGLIPVDDTQVHARADLADLVANVLGQQRCL